MKKLGVRSVHRKNASKAAKVSWIANELGVPLAYLYADNSELAEVILAFGLLPEREQRRLAVELKARVSPSEAKANHKPRAPGARRAR